MTEQAAKPHVLLAHAIGIALYGTLDRERAAFIQVIAEKEALLPQGELPVDKHP